MLKFVLMTALFLAASPLPASAQPEAAVSESRTPLVVIRFSQRNVYFEKALYNAVDQAIATKPDVVFDVVAYPGARSSLSNTNLGKVTRSLNKMGVPPARIATATGEPSGERYDEIRVYVR